MTQLSTYYGLEKTSSLLNEFHVLLGQFNKRTCIMCVVDRSEILVAWKNHEVNDSDITQAIRNISRNLNRHLDCSVVFSTGIAETSNTKDDFNTLYRNCFENSLNAPYLTKQNQYYQLFGQPEEIEQQLTMTEELLNAVNEDKITIEIQPRFHLRTNIPMCAEVNLAWYHDFYGYVSPQVFVPLLVKLGLYKTMFLRMVDLATEAGQKIKSSMPYFELSFDFCASQLKDHNLIMHIIDHCKPIQSDFSLDLELSEECLVDLDDEDLKTLKLLSNEGFHLTLDHFGSRLSKLSNLAKIPLSSVKFDRELVQNLDDGYSRKILKTLTNLSSSLELGISAAGVSDFEQMKTLRKLGCEMLQGDLLMKPLSVNEFIEFMHS